MERPAEGAWRVELRAAAARGVGVLSVVEVLSAAARVVEVLSVVEALSAAEAPWAVEARVVEAPSAAAARATAAPGRSPKIQAAFRW